MAWSVWLAAPEAGADTPMIADDEYTFSWRSVNSSARAMVAITDATISHLRRSSMPARD